MDEERLASLEASAEAAQIVVSLLIAALPDEGQAALRRALEPLRRRIAAEAPRPGQKWQTPGARALNRAVDWIDQALEGEDLSEV